MARTVKVGLEVDEKNYVRGVERSTKTTEDFKDSLDDVKGSAKDMAASTEKAKDSVEDLGDSAKDAGDDLSRLRTDAARLDRQIDQTSDSIRDLARQIAAASDEAERANLSEKLKVERGKQRQQINLRKLIDFKETDVEVKEQGVRYGARFSEGLAQGLARAGGPISSALSAVFGGLPPQAQAAIGGSVIAAVSSVAPLVGGAIGGAVVGAAGAGGIVGGIAIAARHPQVQASAALTGQTFAEVMQRAGVSFVPVTLEALRTVRAGIGDMEGDLQRALSASSEFVAPLTDDFLAGAERAVEGFATAVERAGPVIDTIGEIGRRAGDMLADTFEGLSEHSSEGAHALLALWSVFEFGIRSIAGTIEMLTAAYGWMEKFSAAARGDVAELGRLKAEQDAAKKSSGGLSNGLQDLISSFGETEQAAAAAAAEVESFDDMVKRLTAENLNAEQANIQLEEAIDRATEAGRRNNDGIDENTEKGRANRKVLLDLARASEASSTAILQQTGSTELASAATERGRAKFLEAARAMGVEKGEALRLANQLFAIPKKVDTKITVTANTQPAIDNARSIVARINQLKARINVYANPSGSFGGGAHTGLGYSTGNRWGGIYQHAQVGALREAHVAAPVAPARYAYAEPATGGEAFIPRFGNRDRSLDILSRAARWYGQQIMPAGMGGGGVSVSPEVRVFIGDQELRGMVRVEVAEHNRGLKRRVSAGAGR